MTKPEKPVDHYLSAFVDFAPGVGENGDRWVHPLREEARDQLAATGLPTTKDEAWRFTNVAPLTRVPFQLAARPGREVALDEIARFALGVPDVCRMVFVDGLFAPELSQVWCIPEEVTAMPLDAAMREVPDMVRPHLGGVVNTRKHPFAALNTAFVRHGAFVSIPDGFTLPNPLYILFVSTGGVGPTVTHPRVLIVAGAGSEATIVEGYMGFEGAEYFTNAVTEIVLGENAHLDHVKIEEEGHEAFHIAATQVEQQRSSSYTSNSISLGGGLVRNDIGSTLAGEGVDCTLNGLYLASGDQLVDNHTAIDHAEPHSQSRELYKGVMDDRSRAVFNGRVLVRQDAQKTDARQSNRNLLLSEDCLVNTKPELEIYADDVKCAHGATIGQLDEESIFYLRSRGIDRKSARSILTYAFASEIVEGIRVVPVRRRLESNLVTRFRTGQVIKGAS